MRFGFVHTSCQLKLKWFQDQILNKLRTLK
jgi:hypothetical protein